MDNLEPNVYRQRLVIEGHYGIEDPMSDFMRVFLNDLSKVLVMKIFSGPFCWPPDPWNDPEVYLYEHRGLNGFVAWEESGCHVYIWKRYQFFTVDVYSCKPFNADEVVEFTKKYFSSTDAVHGTY